MYRRSCAAFTAVLAPLLVLASDARAQSCAAHPTLAGQGSIGPAVSFPNGATGLGVEGSWNWAGPVGLFATFNLQVPDDDDVGNLSIFGGGASYEITDFIPIIPEWLSVCPVAAVNFSSFEGTTTLTFPLGVGLGTRLELSPDGPAIVPHVMPQFVLTRVSVEDVTVTDHNFGIGFGGLGVFGPVYAGVTLNRLFVDAADIDVALRAGWVFAWRR